MQRLIDEGRLDRVRDYCLQDVAQTAALYLRFELLRGRIGRPAYRVAIQQWAKVVRATRGPHHLFAGMDVDRVLLGDPIDMLDEDGGEAEAYQAAKAIGAAGSGLLAGDEACSELEYFGPGDMPGDR